MIKGKCENSWNVYQWKGKTQRNWVEAVSNKVLDYIQWHTQKYTQKYWAWKNVQHSVLHSRTQEKRAWIIYGMCGVYKCMYIWKDKYYIVHRAQLALGSINGQRERIFHQCSKELGRVNVKVLRRSSPARWGLRACLCHFYMSRTTSTFSY
jgi:hypothetical protein